MERKTVLCKQLFNAGHIGRNRQAREPLEELFNPGRRDKNHHLSWRRSHVTECVNVVSRPKNRLAHRSLDPLTFAQKLLLAFEDGKDLVLSAVAMRRRTTAKWCEIQHQGAGALAHGAVDQDLSWCTQKIERLNGLHHSLGI